MTGQSLNFGISWSNIAMKLIVPFYLLGILCAIFLNVLDTQRTQDLYSLRKQHPSGLLRRRLAKEFLQMVIFQIKMAENVPL